MSMGPDKVHTALDMFRTNGTAGFGTTTGTRAYDALTLPAGKKAVQVSLVTSATVTLNIQNSVDRTNWFNVLITTNASVLAEIDSVVPHWRLNVTSHSTSGTGASAAMVAQITQAPS